MKRGARPIRHTATATIERVELGGVARRQHVGALARQLLAVDDLDLARTARSAGTTIAASGQKTLGRVFSADARRRGEEAATRGYPMTSKSAPRASSFVKSFS